MAVRALNSIFQQWRISTPTLWNTTGDPCTGSAIDSTKVDSSNINPAIKCDCSFDNGTTCHLRELSFGGNALSGSVPKELGNLQNLRSLLILTIGSPYLVYNPQLKERIKFGDREIIARQPWQLVNLQEFYIDSAGLSGGIPSTFANLKNLQILRSPDNQFTGKIPDFIGNWTKLTILRIQGNSFQGPIPSSFSRLTKLTDL
ncbi:hypothetical protein MRB53_020792 [Persea americana]|uniref:Uncharacterized protein n=1 Tax=Persea americana TaxID=3435 RepID=A0ACC2L2L0_PERAE|nr:hypothetical protein MRB53_020792 [Persea americana]